MKTYVSLDVQTWSKAELVRLLAFLLAEERLAGEQKVKDVAERRLKQLKSGISVVEMFLRVRCGPQGGQDLIAATVARGRPAE